MKQDFKQYLSLALLCSTAFVLADSCPSDKCDDNKKRMSRVIGCFTPRSQSKNNVIKNAGLDPYLQHRIDQACNAYSNIAVALEYTQSFNGEDLGHCMWGPAVAQECGSGVQINVRGTKAENKPNGTSDLVADQFFLPKDFESVLTVKPKIKNVNVHLQFYAGLDNWVEGMYFRAYTPITHTRWSTGLSENVIAEGTIGFKDGEVAPNAVTDRANMFTQFKDYLQGNTLELDENITVQPLQNAKYSCDTLTKTRLADFRVEMGWNFAREEDFHFGLYGQAALPAGNDCNPCFAFAPIVGNGRHWEIGAGMTSHLTLWRSEDDDKKLDFFVEGDASHPIKHAEKRVFDLVGKPLSRYMMVQKMQTPDDTLFVDGINQTAPNAQFADEYAPLANISAQDVLVSISVHGELTAKFVFSTPNFAWELGYDLWARSCEDIERDFSGCATPFQENTWALRGDAQAFGFTAQDEAVALGATRNAATIFSLQGGGAENVIAADSPTVSNNNIDTPARAFRSTDILFANDTDDAGFINTSAAARLITIDDLDIEGVELLSTGIRSISQKIFTSLTYSWTNNVDWTPFINIGGSAEFGSNGDGTNSKGITPCNDCVDCALSQWAVWLKGGITFN